MTTKRHEIPQFEMGFILTAASEPVNASFRAAKTFGISAILSHTTIRPRS